MARAAPPTHASKAGSSLIRSIRHVMRPVIRLMMRHGIVLQSFQELVKSVYTEEAEKEIRTSGNPVTDLQISLMTGLHRKEVKRFREEGYETFLMSPTLSTRIRARPKGDRSCGPCLRRIRGGRKFSRKFSGS